MSRGTALQGMSDGAHQQVGKAVASAWWHPAGLPEPGDNVAYAARVLSLRDWQEASSPPIQHLGSCVLVDRIEGMGGVLQGRLPGRVVPVPMAAT